MRAFENYNPIVIFVYFMAVTVTAMFSVNPLILAFSFIGALVFCISRGKTKAGFHLFIAALFAVTALINPLFYHNGVTVLFVMNNNPVTLEAVIYGIFAAFMIASVLYWFRSFSQIMTGDRLLYLFGAVSPKIALLLSMTLRYIPLFGTQLRKVSQTQKALGLYKENNAIDTVKSGVRIFSVMVTWGLENGIITADSMTARAYGTGRRTFYSLYRFMKDDVILLIIILLLFSATLFGVGTGACDFEFYPKLGSINTSFPAVIAYIAYGFLSILPTLIKAEENIKWKYLKSTI